MVKSFRKLIQKFAKLLKNCEFQSAIKYDKIFMYKNFFQITIFEHITDFAVGINYIDQGTNLLRPGLGPLNEKVPLGQYRMSRYIS